MDEDKNQTAEELKAEADLASRIAKYLRLNGFANLEEAAAKGWGRYAASYGRADALTEKLAQARRLGAPC